MSEKVTEHHRVHFGEGADTFGKDNEIVVQPAGDGKISLHLGFLKLCHRYKITVDLPRTLCGLNREDAIKEHEEDKIPNVNCKIKQISSGENAVSLVVELVAHKEKLLKEEVSIEVGSENTVHRIVLIARVLGKGQGTPLLRNGIHCIGNEEVDDESEASDWQGFDNKP
ncbi:UPF0687 protein [Gryllus bimaculatus]|nr:UPF0687 protein [Gryllus bimaculatus]